MLLNLHIIMIFYGLYPTIQQQHPIKKALSLHKAIPNLLFLFYYDVRGKNRKEILKREIYMTRVSTFYSLISFLFIPSFYSRQ